MIACLPSVETLIYAYLEPSTSTPNTPNNKLPVGGAWQKHPIAVGHDITQLQYLAPPFLPSSFPATEVCGRLSSSKTISTWPRHEVQAKQAPDEHREKDERSQESPNIPQRHVQPARKRDNEGCKGVWHRRTGTLWTNDAYTRKTEYSGTIAVTSRFPTYICMLCMIPSKPAEWSVCARTTTGETFYKLKASGIFNIRPPTMGFRCYLQL